MVPCTDALQVKHRPYMGPSEIPYTGEDGVGLHRQLESNLADIAQRGKKAARKGIRLGHKVGMTNKQATASYFWNCTCIVAAPHGLPQRSLAIAYGRQHCGNGPAWLHCACQPCWCHV